MPRHSIATAFVASVTLSPSSSAFTTMVVPAAATRIAGRLRVGRGKSAPQTCNKSRIEISTTSTSIYMIFGDLFRSLNSGGGAFGASIDYSGMPFPVPKLASNAKEGKVPEILSEDEKIYYNLATFAGGCFWGLQLAYQRVPGVEFTAAGYTQGMETCPNYDSVCAGATRHTEAVIVFYNPEECTYESLLDVFFERVDPTTVNGQGSDRGTQYRTGVYYNSKEQEQIVRERFVEEQKKYKRSIETECKIAMPFWPAEAYHQQYLAKGGRFQSPQSAEKGCADEIRCYG